MNNADRIKKIKLKVTDINNVMLISRLDDSNLCTFFISPCPERAKL
jgi:hypothetical protein